MYNYKLCLNAGMEMNKVLRERIIAELHFFGKVKEGFSEEGMCSAQIG